MSSGYCSGSTTGTGTGRRDWAWRSRTTLALGQAAAQGQSINEVQELVGRPVAQAIQSAIESAGSAVSNLYATGLGIITLVLGGRPGPGAAPSASSTRFWSFTVVVGVGFLLLVSLGASAWLAAFGTFFSGLLPLPRRVMEASNALVSCVLIGLSSA